MKTESCILGLLIAIGVGHAQDISALERLPFQRWVAVKSAAGMETSFDPPKKNSVAGKWSLSEQNITTQISEAYRYKDNIVVFGWSGNAVGIVTIIDASTGREKLQLLVKERDRFITNNGVLLYSHWFVKEAYNPDDSVWLLNLNYPLPAPVSQLPNGIVVEIGTQVYPGLNDKQVRHSVRDLLISANGQELFFTDWPVTETEPSQLCFVRIDSVQSPKTKTSRNCVNGAILTGYPLSDIKSSALDFDQNGALRFSLSLREPSTSEHFVVDPTTLVTLKSSDKASDSDMDSEGGPPLRIPWDVERRSLASGGTISLQQAVFAGHEQDRLVADLLISEAGAVMKVVVTGSTPEVRQQIEATIRTWSFKPTFLDGHATKVRVRIEFSPESLFQKS